MEFHAIGATETHRYCLPGSSQCGVDAFVVNAFNRVSELNWMEWVYDVTVRMAVQSNTHTHWHSTFRSAACCGNVESSMEHSTNRNAQLSHTRTKAKQIQYSIHSCWWVCDRIVTTLCCVTAKYIVLLLLLILLSFMFATHSLSLTTRIQNSSIRSRFMDTKRRHSSGEFSITNFLFTNLAAYC